MVFCYHRALYIDLTITTLTKHQNYELSSPFARTSKYFYPKSVQSYTRYLKEKSQISENIKALRKIVNRQKLTTTEEQILKNKDTSITKIMLEVERKEKINTNSPWSPDLHIVIQTFTIWKLIKTQIATHISQHFQTK